MTKRNHRFHVAHDDPATHQQAQEALERSRFIAAIKAGEQAILDGRTKSAEEVFADLRVKHG